MRYLHTILPILFLFGTLTARSQDIVWAEQIDNTFDGHLYVRDNLADKYGNVYISGQFDGTVDFDPGPGVYNLVSPNTPVAFILKCDPSGKLLWANAILCDTVLSNASGINAMAVDNAGSVYALGYFRGTADFDPGPGTNKLVAVTGTDMFIQKFDSSGKVSWLTHFPETYSVTTKDIALALKQKDVAGSDEPAIYVTGTFGGTMDFDPSPAVYNMTVAGGLDIFILKITNKGAFVWAKQISGTAMEYPSSMAIDGNCDVYLTGNYSGTADFDPGAGVYNMTSNGYSDIFVTKIDTSGKLVWANSMGSTGEELGISIACDKSGNTYTTGKFMRDVDFDPGAGVDTLTSAGYYDAFILKLDHNGLYRWAKRIGGRNGDMGLAISLSGVSVSVATVFVDSIDLDPGPGSLYMGAAGKLRLGYISLDTAGNLRWAMAQGSIPNILATTSYMAEDELGYIYATGYFFGTIDCDPGPAVHNLASVANNIFSYFILKLKPVAATVAGFEQEMKNYRIYPNPGNGVITISAERTIDRIIVTDMAGKVICNMQPTQKNISLNIPYPGMYMVSLISGRSVAVEKIIVTATQ